MPTETSNYSDDQVTVAEVIDEIPVGRFHRRVLAVCGSAWAFDGMEVIIISFTLPVLIEAWQLSGITAGLLGSASLMGMIVGNWFWGWYADRAGRLAAFQWTVLSYSLFAELTAFAQGFPTGFVLRFLTGVGLGGALAVDTSYLSEHLPTDRRGRYMVYLDAFWPVGTVLAVGLAWLFLSFLPTDGMIPLPGLGPVAGWRVLFASAALPAFLVFVIRRHLEETPYYLARSGNIREANQRIEAIARENGEPFSPVPEGSVEPSESTPGFRRLFRSDLIHRSLMIAGAWFAINFGYYGVFIWLPQTVDAAGIVGNVYLYFLLIAVVQFPGYFSAAYLVDFIGRKWTLGIYLIGSGLFTFLFASTMPGVDLLGPGISGLAPFIGGLLVASFFALGAWGAIYAYTPELFPTDVRATGNGFAGGVGKVAAVIGPILAGFLLDRVGHLAALLPLAAVFLLGGLLVLIASVETRGQALT